MAAADCSRDAYDHGYDGWSISRMMGERPAIKGGQKATTPIPNIDLKLPETSLSASREMMPRNSCKFVTHKTQINAVETNCREEQPASSGGSALSANRLKVVFHHRWIAGISWLWGWIKPFD